MIERVIPNAWLRAFLWLIARGWVGYQFLMAGWDKLFGTDQALYVGAKAGAGGGGYLTHATSAAMTTGAHATVLPPFQWLATTFLIPSAIPLGYIVAIGETAIGLALILGLFTRAAAFGGGVLNLLYLLAGTAGLNPYMFTIEAAIVLVVATAGWIGLDYYAVPFVKAEWAQWREGQGITLHLPGGHAPRPAH